MTPAIMLFKRYLFLALHVKIPHVRPVNARKKTKILIINWAQIGRRKKAFSVAEKEDLFLEDLVPEDLGSDDLGPEDLSPDDLGPEDLAPDDLGPEELGPEELGPDDFGCEFLLSITFEFPGRFGKFKLLL